MPHIYYAVLDLIMDPEHTEHFIMRKVCRRLEDAEAIPPPLTGQYFMDHECRVHIARHIVDFWLDESIDAAVFAFRRAPRSLT